MTRRFWLALTSQSLTALVGQNAEGTLNVQDEITAAHLERIEGLLAAILICCFVITVLIIFKDDDKA